MSTFINNDASVTANAAPPTTLTPEQAALVERLRELLAKATPHWQIYSEPEVGLPASLFGGAPGPMHSGFGPIEPLAGADLQLAAETVNALPTLLSLIEAQAAEIAALKAPLRIGDKVDVIGEYQADWRGQNLWVAGIAVHGSGEGLNITVSEQWPIPPRHSGGYRGLTDGFRETEIVRAARNITGESE